MKSWYNIFTYFFLLNKLPRNMIWVVEVIGIGF